MAPKAQLSLFFILGVVLVIVAGLILSSGKETMPNQPKSEISLEPLNQYVESCLKSTIENGIYFIGSQGGYNHPAHAHVFEDREVALYLEGQTFSVPTLYTIEEELANYVEQNLPRCVDNFKGLSGLGFQISAQNPNSRASVGENDITAFVSYPITISQGSNTAKVEEFGASVPFDFKEVYAAVQQIMIKQGEDPLAAHIGFLSQAAYERDYFFDIVQMDDQTIVYSLYFNSAIKNNEPYIYRFAVKYDW